jgi:hypothetical protein
MNRRLSFGPTQTFEGAERSIEGFFMQFFTDDVILPYLRECGYRKLCEIGAQSGGNTDKLLGCGADRITVIDPCFDADLEEKYRNNPKISVHRGRSLDVLPGLMDSFDCILIDGDHNWYTVFNELVLIARMGLLKAGGLILLHDVAWPYARRDMYYDPPSIPASFRHPYARKGIAYNQSELLDTGGVNAWLNNACFEGGPQNGVLTAVEDVLIQMPETFSFFSLEQEFGLGFLFKGSPPTRIN